MKINSGISAYVDAMQKFNKAEENFRQKSGIVNKTKENLFAETLKNSLNNVNELQTSKNKMIESFAAGETQNVHELMISLQKAGLAVNMTSAVRNKVLEAYRELSKLQF